MPEAKNVLLLSTTELLCVAFSLWRTPYVFTYEVFLALVEMLMKDAKLPSIGLAVVQCFNQFFSVKFSFLN